MGSHLANTYGQQVHGQHGTLVGNKTQLQFVCDQHTSMGGAHSTHIMGDRGKKKFLKD